MSRIGKLPILIPDGVQVTVDGNKVTVKGPKGTLTVNVRPQVKVVVDGKNVVVQRSSNDSSARSLHGLTRSLVKNMVTGVTSGFEKKLELNGVGFRAQVQGKKLSLSIGFSHPVVVEAPEGVSFEVKENIVTVKGSDRWLVGETAALIRSRFVPEPYKGKGIRYIDEQVKRKEGKRVVATTGT